MISIILMVIVIILWVLYGMKKIKIVYPLMGNGVQLLWLIYIILN